MHRVWIAVLACAVAACSSLALAGGASASDDANALRSSCDQFRLGSTYITSLKQRNTKCGTAKKVATKYTDCRKDNGGAKGHCNSDVAHYSCNEGKRSGNKFQFSAKVKCERGGNKVVFNYTQNT